MSEPAREALKDRNQLYRHYRVAKTAEHEELFALPEYGDRLRRFNATLGHFGIADSGALLLARAEGKPVVAIAAIYQRSPVTLRSSSVTNLM